MAPLPLYPAHTRPPKPAALHDDCDCVTDTDTETWRGNGLVALMPAHTRPPKPAALHENSITIPKLEGQRPRCPHARAHKAAEAGSPPHNWRGNGLVALLPRAHLAAKADDPPQSPVPGSHTPAPPFQNSSYPPHLSHLSLSLCPNYKIRCHFSYGLHVRHVIE